MGPRSARPEDRLRRRLEGGLLRVRWVFEIMDLILRACE